jgi:hypothetical protein
MFASSEVALRHFDINLQGRPEIAENDIARDVSVQRQRIFPVAARSQVEGSGFSSEAQSGEVMVRRP